MAGKTRPSLRAKTLQNVALSNLSLTDKQCIESVFEKFEALSKADVEGVKHGEWKHTVEKGTVFNHHFFTCSLCGASAFTSGYEKYCHECGAKMDGGDAE